MGKNTKLRTELIRRSTYDPKSNPKPQWRVEIVSMVDEFVNSKTPLLNAKGKENKHRRYWGSRGDNQYEKTYQCGLMFYEFTQISTGYKIWFRVEGCGMIRVLDKHMNKLNEKDVLDFFKEFRNYVGKDMRIYADNRTLSALVSRKYKHLNVEIRKKFVTSRVDAVFGFKRQIYKALREKKIKGYDQFMGKYKTMIDNLNLIRV